MLRSIWAMKHVLYAEREEGNLRDTYVLAAAQWILWNEQSLFM